MKSKKQKILFFVSAIRQGGRERRLTQLLKGLSKSNSYELHLAVFSDEMFYGEISDFNVVIHDFSNAKSFIKRYNAINTLFEDTKPAIVHSWLGNSIDLIFVILKYKFCYKYIAGYVADGIRLKCPSKSYIEHKLSFWGADAIVSNSQSGLSAKKAPRAKSYVIPNGFDFERLPKDFNKLDKLGELGIDAKQTICMVARVTPQKDYNLFLNVAKRFLTEQRDVAFLAVGGGELLDTYKERLRAEHIGNVKFLGARSDVEEILSACDISVLFSVSQNHAEGISNSIMESLAAGTPVIATNNGGTPEIIVHNYNGFLIEDGDSGKAYEYITKLLDDHELLDYMGKNAKHTIENKFSLEKMVVAYDELYTRLIKG